MKRLDQLVKGVVKTKKETASNTRRAAAIFPHIERKLDIVARDNTFRMDVPLATHPHSAILTLRIKPDNCCDCEPGMSALEMSCIGYFDGNIGPAVYEDGVVYPANFISAMSTTKSIFNYGYTSPFFHHIFDDSIFSPLGNYSVVDGGIMVPTDGVYAILFKTNIGGSLNTDSSMTISVQQSSSHYTEDIVLSKKTYSVSTGDLTTGSKLLLQYAACVNLRAGDIVRGCLQVTDIPGFTAGSSGSMSINLIGMGYGALIGHVYEITSGNPIYNVKVSFTIGPGGTTQTDALGAYSLIDIYPGTYSLTASIVGYISQTQTVVAPFNGVGQIDFNLTHT